MASDSSESPADMPATAKEISVSRKELNVMTTTAIDSVMISPRGATKACTVLLRASESPPVSSLMPSGGL